MFLTNFNNFIGELIIVIEKQLGKFQGGQLVYKTCPSLDAYEYQAFSPRKIKSSDIDYGLMYL